MLLTGWFHPLVQTPGIQQAWELKKLLQQRKQEVRVLDQRLAALEKRSQELAHNPKTQEAQIRRVLGFVSEREIVFDFVPSNP